MDYIPALEHFSTFSMGGTPKGFCEIKHENDLFCLLPRYGSEQWWVLGGGSNTVFTDSYVDKIVVKISLRGLRVISETNESVVVSVAAGEVWDDFVSYACRMGYVGTELLSGIPGTVGAAPVQNIGAYGKEVCEIIETVECFDCLTRRFHVFSKEECMFRYRDSIFKSNARGRYIITSAKFALVKNTYAQVHHPEIVAELSGAAYTAAAVREAVLAVRKRKLPDIFSSPNVGSFFQNPIIPEDMAIALRAKFPTMPMYSYQDGSYKISAAWLIESVGYKGKRCGHFEFSSLHALVLVHLGGGTMDELLLFVAEVRQKVYGTFQISLSIEPELVF